MHEKPSFPTNLLTTQASERRSLIITITLIHYIILFSIVSIAINLIHYHLILYC